MSANVLPAVRGAVRAYLHGVRGRNATALLERRLATFNKGWIFDGERMEEHCADQELEDVGLQNAVRSFVIERVRFIEEIVGLENLLRRTFADVGDSSGIFLRALGQPGTSVNIAEAPLLAIRAKGFRGVRGDIERLPFPDKTFDHVLCFETLEHVPNPIAALRELARVVRRSAIVSVPNVRRTNIHRFNYRPSTPTTEHHIFEFCQADFEKIVTHTPFHVDRVRVTEVLNDGNTIGERLVFAGWRTVFGGDLFCGCFRRFLMANLAVEGA